MEKVTGKRGASKNAGNGKKIDRQDTNTVETRTAGDRRAMEGTDSKEKPTAKLLRSQSRRWTSVIRPKLSTKMVLL